MGSQSKERTTREKIGVTSMEIPNKTHSLHAKLKNNSNKFTNGICLYNSYINIQDFKIKMKHIVIL